MFDLNEKEISVVAGRGECICINRPSVYPYKVIDIVSKVKETIKEAFCYRDCCIESKTYAWGWRLTNREKYQLHKCRPHN